MIEECEILHGFADDGGESEILRHFGDVVRFGIDPSDNGIGEVVTADGSRPDELPFYADEFDLAFLHPPCGPWANMTNNANSHDDHPQLVEQAREIGHRYADHYVIENVPRAPLRDPVVLDGRMFGLPVKYERAFETSFEVTQPTRHGALTAETSSYYYSEKPHEWWANLKGVPPGKYGVEHTAKNITPAAYTRYVLAHWVEAVDQGERPNYDGYHDELDERQAREENAQLAEFGGGQR